LAGALPLFLGTLLSDWAYSATYEVQWTNFASWLLAGALLLSGFALLWSFMNMFRRGRRQKRTWLTFLLLLATFTVGFINALVHTKDGWAVVPEGLVLSFMVAVLAAAAVWTGFAGGRLGAIR
jgi:uncharacterized membrane protein